MEKRVECRNAGAWLSDGIWESEHEFLSQETLLWQRRMTGTAGKTAGVKSENSAGAAGTDGRADAVL